MRYGRRGWEMRSKRARVAQVSVQNDPAPSGETYREFGGRFAFATVAEEPVLWCVGRLRHLHGEAQRLTSARQPINGSALRLRHN